MFFVLGGCYGFCLIFKCHSSFMNVWIDEFIDRWRELDGQVDGWMDREVNGWVDEWMEGGRVNRWTDGLMDASMDG